MKQFGLSLSAIVAGSALVFCLACGGSGGGSISAGTPVTVTGKATFPVDGLSNSATTPLKNAQVSIVDFSSAGRTSRSAKKELVGQTDEEGNWSVTVDARIASFIVIEGNLNEKAAMTSGVTFPVQIRARKDLDTVTDLACRAAATSINEGNLALEVIDQPLIDALERTAGEVLAEEEIDFTDPDAVGLAARKVIERSRDSFSSEVANPLATPAPTVAPSNSSRDDKLNPGGFDCGNGSYQATGGGCGISTFSLRDNGTSISLENFGSNPSTTCSLTNNLTAQCSGLNIFGAPEHECDIVCDPRTGTIRSSCRNASGGQCSQSNSLDCAGGAISSCADGSPICAALVCDGTVQCADGSDEDPNICTSTSDCCQATSGCFGETNTACDDQCCCCPLGQVCDQANFANGCVDA